MTSHLLVSRLVTTIWFSVALSIAAVAHSFPSPDAPESQAEQALADAIAATGNADAAGMSNATSLAARSVYDVFLPWPAKGGITIVQACFWNGSPEIRQAVIDSDAIWEKFANITVNYFGSDGHIRTCSDASSADIRISLDGGDTRLDYDDNRPSRGFWSLVGRQANFPLPGRQPGARYLVTANLPDLGPYLSGPYRSDLNFLVRHELGHARGLLHEHQRQECANWFDVQKIADSQHWTLAYAQAAVASFDQLQNAYHPQFVGPYDIHSVMQYNFVKAWYKEVPGKINPCERTAIVDSPSPGDRSTLIAMYGAYNPQAATRGGLVISSDDAKEAFRSAVRKELARVAELSRNQLALPGQPAAREIEVMAETGRQLGDKVGWLVKAVERLDAIEQGVR